MDGSRTPVGMAIKRGRERLRMTQAQLGDAIGVTQKTIDNWEHDRRYPKSAIGALENVLGISLDDGTAATATLEPTDLWEAAVLADRDLSDGVKVSLVRGSRAARAEYVRRKRQLRADQARQESARSDHGTSGA
jgi:transcriptional regulator with XRE-family HTH domain